MTGFFTHPPRLRDIWRKIALSTALCTTMTAIPAQAQQLSGPDNFDIFHMQPLNPPKTGPLTAQDRQDIAINKALVTAAQKRFLSLTKLGETPYAAELAATEARANAYIKVFGGSQGNSRVVFLDPYHLDIGMSLGLKEPQILRQLLAAEQVKNMPRRESEDIAGKFARRAPSILGYLTHTQEASAHDDGGVGVAVIVPTSDHALLFEIPGLTVAEQVELINTHEMWHTLNNRFNQTHAANEAVGGYLKTGDWPEFVKDNQAMFLYSQLIKSETLSDVAAVGDMIRGGHDIHILDRMRDKRAGNILDTQHMSIEALDALKAHVEKAGIDNFRKLDDKSARDLYLKITDESGVSPGMLKFLYSWYDLPDDAARDAVKTKAATDPDIRRGLAMLPYSPDLSAPPEPGGSNVMTPEQKAADEQLKAMDPLALIEQKAFALAGKATPETYIRAYGALMTDLRGQLREDPGHALLYTEQMTRLQTSFMHHAWEVDYAAVNRRHGVNILLAEPGLRPVVIPAPRPKAGAA